MKNKIAIVGSRGYIASYIKRELEEKEPENTIVEIDHILETHIIPLDLESAEKFDYAILDDVEFVIFTAAISSPDECAGNFEQSWQVNVVGTEYFIREALKRNIKVLFFSSDAVFGETKTKIVYEDAETKTESDYGAMKKHVEDMFKKNANFKAIRLSYVVSQKDKFLAYCLKCLKEEKMAEIYHPFYRNCVSVHDVINAVIWLKNNWESFESPFLNIAGTELVSRIQIADELNRIVNEKLKYKIIDPGITFYRNRAKITHMGSLYLFKKNIVRQKSFFESIEAELKEIQL